MIPKPTPSLVINYYYLWQYEKAKGQENGTKNRPCVIVSAEPSGSATDVIVVPITHTKPEIGEAVEIPPQVMAYLGMDEEPSYIICTEVNTFTWPGFDLAINGDAEEFVFGFLPPKLFEDVIQTINGHEKSGQLQVVSRND